MTSPVASGHHGKTGPTRQGEAEILLESGTNELEVLVFSVGAGTFGVNVAKVREVILPMRTVAAPQQHPCVIGMFNLRGRLLPLVDLHKYLRIEPVGEDRKVIVTEFNGQQAAFAVSGVEQIYRMNWGDMKSVPDTEGQSHFAITGITEIGQRLVLMLDFESISDHISVQDMLHIDRVPNPLGVDRGSARIIVAEDSKFIRGIMTGVLGASGYTQVRAFSNGLDAWHAIQPGVDGQPGCDILVTDIEMPQVDGLHLTRRVKESAPLRHIPVLLFSSLITADTRHKGSQVGADEQIAKPDLPHLVEIVDRWVREGTGVPVTEAAAGRLSA